MKRLISTIALACAVLLAMSCEKEKSGIESISFDKTEISIEVGGTDAITAAVKASGDVQINLVWASDNESVATVNEGVVTGVAEGTANITATDSESGKSASCKVTVYAKAVEVTGVKLDKEELTVAKGNTGKLTATVLPANATNKKCSWSSDNTSVATVADGVVTGVAKGSATITVTTEDGAKTASCKVTVITPVTISFTKAPANGTNMEMNEMMGLYDPCTSFEWKVEDGNVSGFVVKVSTYEDMTDAAVIDLGTATSIDLDNKSFNHLAILGGIEPEDNPMDLYIQVTDKDGLAIPATCHVSYQTRFGSFEDPRDGEIYPTVDVEGITWMCENLRATFYSDGDPMYISGTGMFYGDYTEGPDMDCFFYEDGRFGKRAGAYYGFGNAVRTHYYTTVLTGDNLIGPEDQIQGVCPDGWHVPNHEDWMMMFEKAFELSGDTMDPKFMNEAWGSYYSTATMHKLFFSGDLEGDEDKIINYTNDLGLYFIPAGKYEKAGEAKHGEVAPAQYDLVVNLWNASMFSIWKSFTPYFNWFAGQYYTNSASCHWTVGMALPTRCIKNY